jgi:hypothetical protein
MAIDTLDMRICNKCGIPKLFKIYHKSKKSPLGRSNTCPSCRTIQSRERRNKNPLKYSELNKLARKKYRNRNPILSRFYYFKKKYHLNKENFVSEIQSKLIEQNYCCAICGIKKEFKKLWIDHNHDTGQIRGLLCMSCNTALGFLREDEYLINSLLKYLIKWRNK